MSQDYAGTRAQLMAELRGESKGPSRFVDYLPERRVGVQVTTSGYPGTITRVCEWSDTLVEVRLVSGTVCVDIADCRTVERVIAYAVPKRYEVTLNDGTVVLGKMDRRYGLVALTYSNRTQANRAAEREPDAIVVQRGRPFYVRLPGGR